jgi:hypothetical protein
MLRLTWREINLAKNKLLAIITIILGVIGIVLGLINLGVLR